MFSAKLYCDKVYAFTATEERLMAKDNIRKIKVLKLLEHLRQNTDENHPLTAGQIAADLAAMGIPFDPRTISQDIVRRYFFLPGSQKLYATQKEDQCPVCN